MKKWENYKNTAVNAVLKSNVYRLIFRDQLNIRWEFRLWMFLKNFSFQPRVERRENDFFLFILFLLSCVGKFILKMFTRNGENGVGNTSFCCYASDGSLFASLHMPSETIFRVVCGVNYKCLFVVLYRVQRWEAFRIFTAIKVTGSSVRSWSGVYFSVLIWQKGIFCYRS